MGRILKDIYADVSLASLLGFKGGSCAYFFYRLPRFSVDLDFDLLNLDEKSQELVFANLTKILGNYGELKDRYRKRFTIFFLLSYGAADRNVKVEVNTRNLFTDFKEYYEMKDYLGISLLAAKKDYLFAAKLAALTSRKNLAARDVYDIYYFAKNSWDINARFVKQMTGKSLKDQLAACVAMIQKVQENQILQGLGELLGEEEKLWAKKSLREETIFLLKNYQAVLK